MTRAWVDRLLDQLEASGGQTFFPWQREIIHGLLADRYTDAAPVAPTDETPLLTTVLMVVGVSLLAWGLRNAVQALRGRL